MNEQTLYAVAIGRVSTPKQDVFGDSLGDQEKQTDLAKTRAEQQNGCKIKIIKTFEFTESASVSLILQPLQKVLTYCKQNRQIKFAFIKSIDRYTRAGAVVYGELRAEFAKLGVTPIDTYGIISSQEVNTLGHLGIEYPWSKFQPTFTTELLEAERAKAEVRDIETRMIGASIRYVRMGYWRGAVPLGYITKRVDTLEVGKRLVLTPHPTESMWFIKMYELASLGTKTESQISDEVNLLGFRTRPKNYHDKEDRNKVVEIKGNLKLTPKGLRKYLQNPIYAGVNTEHWLTLNGKLQPIYIKGEGIVDIELFNKVNQGKISIVNENGLPKIVKGMPPDWQKNKLKLNPKYPYKQQILCPICRRNLKASSPAGKLKHYDIYFCSEGHKYYGINANKLDNIIKDFVIDVRFSDEFKEEFKDNFIKNWNLRMELLNKDAINWEKRIIELREQKNVAENQLNMATTATGINIFEQKVEGIKEAISNAMLKRNQTEDEEVDVQVLTNTAKYWMEHYEELVLSVPNPLIKASLFGQIFEEPPTVEELENRTPKLSPLFALSALSTKGVDLQCEAEGTRTLTLSRDRGAL